MCSVFIAVLFVFLCGIHFFRKGAPTGYSIRDMYDRNYFPDSVSGLNFF
jgi:hypothetical protein